MEVPNIDPSKLDNIRQKIGEKLKTWESRILISMAYKPIVIRVEGEQWTDNGKTWVLKDGIQQSISVTQSARMPFWCPRCEKPMNHRFDRKFYNLRGWCYDCNVVVEHEMRLNGTYEQWERQLVRANEVALLKDKIAEHLSYIKDFKVPTVYFENGGYEQIASKEVFQPVFDKLMIDVEFMLNRIESIQQEELSNDGQIKKNMATHSNLFDSNSSG